MNGKNVQHPGQNSTDPEVSYTDDIFPGGTSQMAHFQ